MTEEIVQRRNETLVRRQRLAPGDSTPWHLDDPDADPQPRVTEEVRDEAGWVLLIKTE